MPTVRRTLTGVLCAAALALPAAAATDKLLASDGAAGDWFGGSVSVSGDTALVGAHGDCDNGSWSGSAYVFVRGASGWTEQAKLMPSDAGSDQYFGVSVSVSGDMAIVGACVGNGIVAGSGSAHVFVRSGSTWTEQAKLTASDGAADDNFGCSVAASGDTAIVGADRDDDNGNSSGSAYVFVRSGTTWTEQAKLTASDGGASDYFGDSISIDNATAVMGAAGDDDNGDYSGSAYVFVRSGSTWTEQAKLTASDGAAGVVFGSSVSVSGDTALVGAPEDVGGSGSVYVFVRSGSTWTEQLKFTAPEGTWRPDRLGCSVSVCGDTGVLGAYNDDNNGSRSGSAFIFVRSGSSWDQQAKLTAADGAAGDWFGWYVALGDDTVVVGTPCDDGTSGSAYVYDLDMIVTAPTGGESWDAGSSQAITWASRGVTDVTIDLSRDGGTTWEKMVPSTPAAAGAYLWTVTGPASADCLIRVSGALDGNPSDESDAPFNIGEQIAMTLPASAREGDGTLTGIGTVDIPTALTSSLTVTLASDDTTEVTVSTEVVIPAGAVSVDFDVTVVDDGVHDGTQTVTVTATAAGWTSGSAEIDIIDAPVTPFAGGCASGTCGSAVPLLAAAAATFGLARRSSSVTVSPC
jgi:hypothetical protein